MIKTTTALIALCAGAAAQHAPRPWFAEEPLPVVEGRNVTHTHFGDVDADGDPDVIGVEHRADGTRMVVVFDNDGAGHFRRATGSALLGISEPVEGIDVADMDGDGDADILAWRAVGDATEFTLCRNRGGTSFESVEISGGNARVVVDDGIGISGRWLPGTSPPAFALPGDGPGVLELHTAPAPTRPTVRHVLQVPPDLRKHLLRADTTDWFDIDGDGDLDVASSAMRFGGESLRVFEQRDGALVGVTHDIVPDVVGAFEGGDCAWADFDGDGRVDIVGANYGPPNDAHPEVFLRRGADSKLVWKRHARELAPRTLLEQLALGPRFAERQTTGVVTGDFDLDGDIDVVFNGGPSSSGYIVENVGDFRFRPHDARNLYKRHGRLHTADIDGDRDLDLLSGATVLRTVRTTPSRIVGFTLTEPIKLAKGAWPHTNKLGDLDGDGDLDILVLQRTMPSDKLPAMAAFANDGRGRLSPMSLPPLTETWPTFTELDTADMDGDGDMDVLARHRDNPRGLQLYRNIAGERMELVEITGLDERHGDDERAEWVRGLSEPAFVLAGDEPDVLEVHRAPAGCETTHVTLITVPADIRNRVLAVRAGAWHDFDGDGDIDIAASPMRLETVTLTLLENVGDGVYVDVTATVEPQGSIDFESSDCTWSDIDGDGHLDLVIAGYGPPMMEEPEALIRMGDGVPPNLLNIGVDIPPRQIIGCAVADFDLDGDHDLIFGGSVSSLSYLAENLGNLTFRAHEFDNSPGFPRIGGYDGHIAQIGDIDGDGDLDALLRLEVLINEVIPTTR